MTGVLVSYTGYATTLKSLHDEGKQALADLDDAHVAVRDAIGAHLRARAAAYDDPTVVNAKAAGERDARVDALVADEKATVEYCKLRVEAINAALREIRSRRSSGDELARCARASAGPGGMDTPGPDVAPLLRRAA